MLHSELKELPTRQMLMPVPIAVMQKPSPSAVTEPTSTSVGAYPPVGKQAPEVQNNNEVELLRCSARFKIPQGDLLLSVPCMRMIYYSTLNVSW